MDMHVYICIHYKYILTYVYMCVCVSYWIVYHWDRHRMCIPFWRQFIALPIGTPKIPGFNLPYFRDRSN